MPRSGQALTTKDGRIRSPAERLREKIQVGKITARLNDCAQGKIDMSSQQIQAARILLNKVVPDAVVERAGDGRQVKDISHQSPHALLRVIEGQAERADEVVISPDGQAE